MYIVDLRARYAGREDTRAAQVWHSVPGESRAAFIGVQAECGQVKTPCSAPHTCPAAFHFTVTHEPFHRHL